VQKNLRRGWYFLLGDDARGLVADRLLRAMAIALVRARFLSIVCNVKVQDIDPTTRQSSKRIGRETKNVGTVKLEKTYCFILP
jgi:hypothetical protein